MSQIQERITCVVFDLDGTLALRGDRDPYDMSRVGEDLPNEPIMMVFRVLQFAFQLEPGEWHIVCTSGRDETARFQTELWLQAHARMQPNLLLMRKEGDNRPDQEVKLEMLRHLREDLMYDVVLAFDDRDRVVKMWRDNDVTCAQVNYGDF